ncbi:MAG: FAD-binding protein [Chloroflexi bacterium]|nr:FAD-binding protein [Chloroflexota bacterium]
MALHPDFVHELQRALAGEVRTDPVTRILYSTDASMYQIEPLGVVIPRTQEDLAAAVELAARYRIPILPRGAGSSLAGQAVGEALILDTSRYLDRILDIDPEARTATVEPGVILSDLNRAAAKYGLVFGPDPASADRATMGGVIANNATGAHSIRYGMAADHILSAEVILADGSLAAFGEIPLDAASRLAQDARPVRAFVLGGLDAPPSIEAAFYSAALHIRGQYAAQIRARWPRVWRNTSGYRLNYLLPWSPSRPPQWEGDLYPNIKPSTLNLAPLLAGSEGTLAVIRRMTVALVPRPAHTVLAVMPFASIAAACDAVPAILEKKPSAVELLPRMLVELARGVPAYARLIDFVDGDPAELLVVEFSGGDPARLREQAKALGGNLRIVTDASAQSDIWKVRKVGLGILSTATSETRGVTFIEDCAVPVERLGDYVRGMERIFKDYGTHGVFYAHASAGCLHMRPVLNVKSEQGRRDLRAIAEAALGLVLSLGGTMTGEHGDGLSRSEFLEQIYGDGISDAFRVLKRAADPQNLLNPGKIVSPPPLDANLRYGPGYRAEPFAAPVLDFSAQGGLVGAIEQCNGAGVCRKLEGTMCPSFQATREEGHSTRGRANLLRAMISGKSTAGGGQWTADGRPSTVHEAVFDALDLCLACKGCQAECPSGVDMAKLKYEFFNHYYKSHRRKLRDYVFGHIGALARLGAPFGGLVNWGLGNQVIGGWTKRLLGIASERALPAFRKTNTRSAIPDPDGETVLYLPDAFTRYFEPEIEQAALRVLRAAGCRVLVLPVLGAGRTLISKGFLDAAKRQARAVLEAVARFDPQGRLPVVGAEPSEVYTLRDEFIDFFPDDTRVQSLAERAWLADEFLVRAGADGRKRILRVATTTQLNPPVQRPKILLHGHCYQKAQPPAADGLPLGQDATAELLRAVGCEVEVIPSGCCGMAGAFGYEEEHYQLSMQVGELVLFPAVRDASAGDGAVLLVAPGASCRSQIMDGAGAEALHPLIVVQQALGFR